MKYREHQGSNSRVARGHCVCLGVLLLLVGARGLCDEPPSIIGYDANHALTWSGTYSNRVAIIEATTNLQTGSWAPFYYDLACSWLPVTLWVPGQGYTNVNYGSGTNNLHVTQLPGSAAPINFYRIALQTNPPDPSLVLHLPFENSFSNGVIVDISGYNNHALQFSPTNWPSATIGPDGRQAAAYGPRRPMPVGDYTQGDYAGIPASPSLDHLSNATLLAWCHCGSASYHNSSIIDAASYGTERSTWMLGREYSYNTRFAIGIGGGLNAYWDALVFPDTIDPYVTYDTGGWHHYGVTWNGTDIIGYFDGLPFQTNSQAGFPELRIGAYQWLSVGCKIHQGTPQWGDDAMPNWGWMTGEIDDVRVYNRALTAAEISGMYGSFDKQSPTVPQNLSATANGSSQVQLLWEPAADNFRVEGYQILRNGVAIQTNYPSRLYFDGDVQAGNFYTYSVRAVDAGGNLSFPSSPASIQTPGAGAQVEVIIDNADPSPWAVPQGKWYIRSDIPGMWGINFHGAVASGTFLFRLTLPEAGEYRVYFWHPGSSLWAGAFITNAPVDVVHAGVTNTVLVNERQNYAQWDLLGTFWCDAGTNNFVLVRPGGASDFTMADAVRFVK